MKNISKFLLVLILLAPVAYADEVQEGLKALNRGDYKTAFEKWNPSGRKKPFHVLTLRRAVWHYVHHRRY